ncbi:serine/threonine-protein kinase [Streptomyces synnematoformans]|uniref:non-specific serine/threonine protein kinase n=1 Tax=Streptomyces synnematoformans TaxID=415721 RepID=A0ABN2XCG9_9ACTN
METGSVLSGRYRLTEPLGRGGSAQVWSAHDRVTDEQVAVKILRLDTDTDGWTDAEERRRERREREARFRRERKLLAELRHPAIPPLRDHGFHEGEPYVVMEYIDGLSLRRFLARYAPLPQAVAVAIAVALAEALKCAHDAGVVHRDLKPDNVVIAGDGNVKLIDFGIAFLTRPGATRYTAAGWTPGSVGYMAPEQLSGVREVTATTDLYAFGCIFFELLTGGQPFHDLPDRNRSIQHLHDEPRRVRDARAGIDGELDELTWRLLRKEPQSRLWGVDEVLATLRRHLPRAGALAPNPKVEPDPSERYRRPRGDAPHAAPPPARPAASRRRPAHRADGWLSRAEFGQLSMQARTELREHGPGPSLADLRTRLPAAVAAWGARDPAVCRAQLLCADGERISGHWEAARVRYEAVITALRDHAVRDLDEIALEARLGAAECRIPSGELPTAIKRWGSAVREVAAEHSDSGELVERSREVGLELSENGFEHEVQPLLDLLPGE